MAHTAVAFFGIAHRGPAYTNQMKKIASKTSKTACALFPLLFIGAKRGAAYYRGINVKNASQTKRKTHT